jgi:hypothetical protein
MPTNSTALATVQTVRDNGVTLMPSDEDPRGAIVAAEVAVSEGELQVALDALHEAKSRVMRRRQEVDHE